MNGVALEHLLYCNIVNCFMEKMWMDKVLKVGSIVVKKRCVWLRMVKKNIRKQVFVTNNALTKDGIIKKICNVNYITLKSFVKL
ncbi:Hypothetical predicted protein [Octopus vulgaris]|uniref:Uncharacterized protein n=1 Tax=Octopus vulgaris TaxID=6645 RepID=A0AA36AZT5_OCTVU|nr:Hypothetical predicted protein [Octopus vulgaris]